MPASRASHVSFGGVALALLCPADLYARNCHPGLIALYLNFGHRDIGVAGPDLDGTGLDLKGWRLAALGPNRAIDCLDPGRSRAARLRDIDKPRSD